MANAKRNIGQEILDGIRQLKRGHHGRIVNVASSRDLDVLTEEFAVLDRMQTPASRQAMRRAFGASPDALGKAAVAAARRRG